MQICGYLQIDGDAPLTMRNRLQGLGKREITSMLPVA
jgi:hypothetical protein